MSLTPKQIRNGSILYHAMMKRNDEAFTMHTFKHPCGTPACAYGYAEAIGVVTLAQRTDMCRSKMSVAREVFGAYSDIFDSGLACSIHTPQDWCAHYAKWLKDHGHEVMTEAEIAMAGQAPCYSEVEQVAALHKGAATHATERGSLVGQPTVEDKPVDEHRVPAKPAPAAPDDGFAAFCAKLLEPVEVKA